jgi:hypothetical protein
MVDTSEMRPGTPSKLLMILNVASRLNTSLTSAFLTSTGRTRRFPVSLAGYSFRKGTPVGPA